MNDQTIKLPNNEELPNKSTIKCVKYTVLNSLVFKIMDRHRGEDHSKLTGIFPWKYFVFTGSLFTVFTGGYEVTKRSSQWKPRKLPFPDPHSGSDLSWSGTEQISFALNRISSLGAEVKLKFCFSNTLNG